MKVIAINGSPHSHGNTYRMLEYMASVLHGEQIDTEIVSIGKKPIQGCLGCHACLGKEVHGCILDDMVNELAESIMHAEGFILGCPNYWGESPVRSRPVLIASFSPAMEAFPEKWRAWPS